MEKTNLGYWLTQRSWRTLCFAFWRTCLCFLIYTKMSGRFKSENMTCTTVEANIGLADVHRYTRPSYSFSHLKGMNKEKDKYSIGRQIFLSYCSGTSTLVCDYDVKKVYATTKTKKPNKNWTKKPRATKKPQTPTNKPVCKKKHVQVFCLHFLKRNIYHKN